MTNLLRNTGKTAAATAHEWHMPILRAAPCCLAATRSSENKTGQFEKTHIVFAQVSWGRQRFKQRNLVYLCTIAISRLPTIFNDKSHFEKTMLRFY